MVKVSTAAERARKHRLKQTDDEKERVRREARARAAARRLLPEAKAVDAAWREANKERRAVERRQRFYNITPEEFIQALQCGCEICGTAFSFSSRRTVPCVDHDHECCSSVPTCGECRRGVICGRCNLMLSFLEGGKQLFLESLLAYLKKYGEKK